MKQIKIKLNSNIKEVKGNLFKKNNIVKVKAGNVVKGKINLKKKIKQIQFVNSRQDLYRLSNFRKIDNFKATKRY